ncbi:MAG: AAA family ATPase [Actinomycetota bacterium]
MTLTPEQAGARCADVLRQVERAVVGKRAAVELALAGVLAGGHVLVEDVPGLGKTLLARSLAQALGLQFRRVQFTPDLLPGDITGSFLFDQRRADFTFHPGPLFTNLLLADEINRTPPKTQSALLEAMQEGQVTVDGTTHLLPRPFHVIATANPIEHEGTYPLPEAQLDRFLLRISLGYPERLQEWEMVRRRLARRREAQVLDAAMGAAELLAAQEAVEDVALEQTVGDYILDLVAATRSHREVLVGASPRAVLALMQVSRALAVLAGRDFVVPEDVERAAVPVLAHRLVLHAESWLRRTTTTQVLEEVLATVPAPAVASVPTFESE